MIAAWLSKHPPLPLLGNLAPSQGSVHLSCLPVVVEWHWGFMPLVFSIRLWLSLTRKRAIP